MQQTIRKVGRRFVTFVKRHRKYLAIIVAGLLGITVVVQLLFPAGMALPFSTVFGERVDFDNREDIVIAVQDKFTKAEVTVKAGDKTYRDELAIFGASINAANMADEVLSYPLIMRLLPFSILWYQPQIEQFDLEFNDVKLSETAEKVSKDLTTDARDASLAVEGGQLSVESAVDGQLVSPALVVSATKQSAYEPGNNVVLVEGERKAPRVSDTAIAAVKQQAEELLDQTVIITVDDKHNFTPSRDKVTDWITVKLDDDKSASLMLAPEKIAQYLKSINQQIQTKPTDTIVSLRDGKEISRKKGKAGLALDTKEAAAIIRDQLLDTNAVSATVNLSMQPVMPPVKYTRSYTSSQAGLSAYVEHMTSGDDIKIALRQLNGDGYFAFGSETDSIPSASTYKLYVMLRLFDDINQGKRNWQDQLAGDNLSTCFERMIVISANNCSEELIKQFGAQSLTDYVRSKGFSQGTGFNYKDATHSTAGDLLKMLVGIDSGSLVKGQNRTMLLEKMSRQIYRNGIPAGSSGSVYNKVGFLWDYNHDAAIVRHPQGDYALVIMTKGHSFSKIAEITREIERIMYP